MLDYEYKDNLFTFAKYEEGGGDGEIPDHVYHAILDEDNPHKKMDYCGDYALYDISENFVFEPVSSHVVIKGNEMDFFDFTLSIENPGIYTFEIYINYVVNGERHSEKIRKYQLYFPSASKIDDLGSFDLYKLYKESVDEACYLYDRIKNSNFRPIVLSEKMDESVRTLKDIYGGYRTR